MLLYQFIKPKQGKSNQKKSQSIEGDLLKMTQNSWQTILSTNYRVTYRVADDGVSSVCGVLDNQDNKDDYCPQSTLLCEMDSLE